MLAGHRPTQPEIVRCHQKDEAAVERLTTHISDLLQCWLGPSSALRWRRHLRLVADISYLLSTTGSARQTLGEEYTNLVLITPGSSVMPSLSLRATMSALQACLPSSSSFLRAQLMKAQLQEDEEDSWDANRVALREAFLIFIRLLPALHLALFYLNGDYFHFAKRITGLRYMRTVSGSQTAPLRRLYFLAGCALLLQTAWRFTAALKALKARLAAERCRRRNPPLPAVVSHSRCALCLEPKRSPAAAPCGHTFCWDCIHAASAASEPVCPMCRKSAPSHRIVPLYNFADE